MHAGCIQSCPLLKHFFFSWPQATISILYPIPSYSYSVIIDSALYHPKPVWLSSVKTFLWNNWKSYVPGFFAFMSFLKFVRFYPYPFFMARKEATIKALHQNFSLFVPQKKQRYTDLEQHEVWNSPYMAEEFYRASIRLFNRMGTCLHQKNLLGISEQRDKTAFSTWARGCFSF